MDFAADSNVELALLIGPEGGFSANELTQLQRLGVRTVRLGPQVLRSETASLAAIAALQVLVGDWR
jgi:16S rRNA (uracil1498-N3)-methyltransferase